MSAAEIGKLLAAVGYAEPSLASLDARLNADITHSLAKAPPLPKRARRVKAIVKGRPASIEVR